VSERAATIFLSLSRSQSKRPFQIWKNNFEDLFSREINIQYFLIQHVFVCVNVCVREFEWEFEYFVWKGECVCVLYVYVYACVWESKSDWEYCVWGSVCFVSTYVYVWVLSCMYVHVSVCVCVWVCLWSVLTKIRRYLDSFWKMKEKAETQNIDSRRFFTLNCLLDCETYLFND